MTPPVRTPIRVDFVADVICPWCWVGWTRLRAALTARPDIEPEIGWRPYQLDPTILDKGWERSAYLRSKFGDDPERIAQMHARIDEMAAPDGIEFRWDAIERVPNTSAAHRLILWAELERRQSAAIDAIFKAYFHDGRDIGEEAVLSAIAGEIGLDASEIAARLARAQDLGAVRQSHALAEQAGVRGVPFYVFGGKLAVSGAQPRTTLDEVIARVSPPT